MRRPEETQTKAIRPSLLANSNETEVANNRILANFEISSNEPSKPATSSRPYLGWRFLLVGTLAILAVGAVGFLCVNALTQIQKTIPVTNPVLLSAAKTPVTTLSSALTPKQQFETESEKQGAVILNDPSAQDRQAESGKTVAEINPAFVRDLPGSQNIESSAGEISKQARNSSTPAEGGSSSKAEIRSAGHASQARNSSSQSREESESGRKSAKQGSGLSKAKTDRDVTLLSTLMGYTNESTTNRGSSGNSMEPVVSKTQQLAKSRLPQTAMANRAESEHGRDVVERKPNDSSDSLLQRCRQLGFVEGQFCRWRICSGRWESDAACKASAGQS